MKDVDVLKIWCRAMIEILSDQLENRFNCKHRAIALKNQIIGIDKVIAQINRMEKGQGADLEHKSIIDKTNEIILMLESVGNNDDLIRSLCENSPNDTAEEYVKGWNNCLDTIRKIIS